MAIMVSMHKIGHDGTTGLMNCKLHPVICYFEQCTMKTYTLYQMTFSMKFPLKKNYLCVSSRNLSQSKECIWNIS